MSKSPPQTNWAKLLVLALEALDTLPDGTRWSWGGGTALAIHLNHRLSLDIDIFLPDAQALRLLSPQRNATVRSITGKWQDPGHYIKLELDDGEIDFIASGLRTDPGHGPWEFEGRELPLETAAEVLAKKLHWRGSVALARDVFDLAAAWRLDAESFALAVEAEPGGAKRLADQITRRGKRIAQELPLAIQPTPIGQDILDNIDLLALATELDGR